MLPVTVKNNAIWFGKNFSLNFQRTLRIPDDNKTYPLPPGLGEFPICKIDDYAATVPQQWKEHGGVFIPMYQREALWIGFRGAHWRPNAVKVAVGKINAVSGKPWEQKLNSDPQDYVVCPGQLWLDGINAGDGYIRQFVAMPLGMGYTVEAQVTGKEEFGGIQILVLDPKLGRFPEKSPQTETLSGRGHGKMTTFLAPMAAPSDAERGYGGEMGLAAGGKMQQKIYPDRYGVETWDDENLGRVYVHIVNSMMYREITGKEPPPTPVSAKMYTQYHLPWFDLYDEYQGDVGASDILSDVKSVKTIDQEKGFTPQQDDTSVEVPPQQIKTLSPDENQVRDGSW